MVGWFPFVAATFWSSTCSFGGSWLAGSQTACPACAPSLVCPGAPTLVCATISCPAVSCNCGSPAAAACAACPAETVCTPCPASLQSGATCLAAPGTSWAALGAAFGAGALAAAAFTWRLQLWLGGAWCTAGRFAVGDGRLAPTDSAPALTPTRRLLPVRAGLGLAELALASLPAASVSSGASSVSGGGEEVSVWRPRRA